MNKLLSKKIVTENAILHVYKITAKKIFCEGYVRESFDRKKFEKYLKDGSIVIHE